ncbi:hypothetical protein AGLY_011218 [Aphis glycines]|uniref:Transmembrane protein n=1 Tax=Aphis glycines TaxID=307491 RepID=A0A6G0TCT9_APHGL|nr:hypothetical protein AGLY_011218 [Aphis glycines]
MKKKNNDIYDNRRQGSNFKRSNEGIDFTIVFFVFVQVQLIVNKIISIFNFEDGKRKFNYFANSIIDKINFIFWHNSFLKYVKFEFKQNYIPILKVTTLKIKKNDTLDKTEIIVDYMLDLLSNNLQNLCVSLIDQTDYSHVQNLNFTFFLNREKLKIVSLIIFAHVTQTVIYYIIKINVNLTEQMENRLHQLEERIIYTLCRKLLNHFNLIQSSSLVNDQQFSKLRFAKHRYKPWLKNQRQFCASQ